jgi:hypothetical protein
LQNNDDNNPFIDWTSHLFTAERTQFIIFSHTFSLYSVVLYGKGIIDEDTFIRRSLDTLREFMEDDHRGFLYKRRIAPYTNRIIFSKTTDRRVLGSLNDMIYQAKVRLVEWNLSPNDVSFELNTIPFSMFNYDNPGKKLDELFAESIRAKSYK